MSNVKQLIKENFSPFIKGTEVDAVLAGIQLEGERQEKHSIACFDQLSLSTASDYWLQRKMAESGVVIPSSLGLDDFIARQIAIAVTANKLLTSTIHEVLEIFYSPSAVRAYAQSDNAEPFDLTNPSDPSLPMRLTFKVDNRQIVYEVDVNDFPTGGLVAATAAQLASAMTKAIKNQGSEGYAEEYIDIDTGKHYLRIFSGTRGPVSQMQVTGGDLIRVLGLPNVTEIVDLLPSPVTSWLVQKLGTTVRFTFQSGDQPSFSLLSDEFTAHIDGAQFVSLNLFGSFPVTTVFQGGAGVGYFEIKAAEANVSSAGSVINQTLVTDLVFSKTPNIRPNSRRKYALAWEPNANTLRIYLPAVSRIITRDLIGAAHMHLGNTTADFEGYVAGSSVDEALKIEVINDYSFAFRPFDYKADTIALGAELTVNYSNTKNYQEGIIVLSGGNYYRAIAKSGPGYGGAQPTSNPTYWEASTTGGLVSYIRRDDGRVLVVMQDGYPHGIQNNPGEFKSDETVTLFNVIVTQDDPVNTFPGAYVYDAEARYTLGSGQVDLLQDISAGNSYSILDVSDTTGIPDKQGYVLFELAGNREEFPVPILGVLPGKIRIDPSYKFAFSHRARPADWSGATSYNKGDLVWYTGIVFRSRVNGNTGNDPSNVMFWENRGPSTVINFLSSKEAVQISPLGTDYPFYVTGTAEARTYAQTLMYDIAASGINLEIVVVYPSGIGLGNGELPTNLVTYDVTKVNPITGGTTKQLNDLIYVYSE